MYELLATASVRRNPAATDLNIPAEPLGADPERAAMPTIGQTFRGFIAVSQSSGASRVEIGASIPLAFADAPQHLAHGAGLDSFGLVRQYLGAAATMTQSMDSGTADEYGPARELVLPRAPDLFPPNGGLPLEDLDWNYLLQGLGSVAIQASTQTDPVASDSSHTANDPTLLGISTDESLNMEAPVPPALNAASGDPAGIGSLANPEASAALLDMKDGGRGMIDLVFAALCVTALPARDPETRSRRASAKPGRSDR
jgi:hypothetical protein